MLIVPPLAGLLRALDQLEVADSRPRSHTWMRIARSRSAQARRRPRERAHRRRAALSACAAAGARTPAAARRAVAALATGCGSEPQRLDSPQIGKAGDEPNAPQQLGFPDVRDEEHDPCRRRRLDRERGRRGASGVPGGRRGRSRSRPRAVVLADQRVWQAGLAAAVLMSRPAARAAAAVGRRGAAGRERRRARAARADRRLRARRRADRAGRRRARAGRLPLDDAHGRGPEPRWRRRSTDCRAPRSGRASRAVVVASARRPAFAMPAAGWAAKTGNPLLFVRRSTIPGPTFAALQAHRRPRIYLLAPTRWSIAASSGAEKHRHGHAHRGARPGPLGDRVRAAARRARRLGRSTTPATGSYSRTPTARSTRPPPPRCRRPAPTARCC